MPILDKLLGLLRLGGQPQNPEQIRQLLRAIIHSQLLSELVGMTGSPIDNLILEILRAIVPPPDGGYG
jgi:hypothetical protein